MVMQPLEMAFAGGVGLCVGSFLNVLIHRVPLELSIVRPGSRCPKCQTPIRWYHNVPLLGFLWLRGRCAKCREPISPIYPIVEGLTALLFIAAWGFRGPGLELFFRDWPFLAALMAVTFIDLEHRIIPDRFSIGGMVWGIATAGIAPELGWVGALVGAGIGFGLFYGLAWAYEAWTGKMGLGGGDVKLLGMIGAFLGVSSIFSTLFLSSVLGSLVGIAWAIGSGTKDLRRFAIPFGPFLVIGALVSYFFGEAEWLQFLRPI